MERSPLKERHGNFEESSSDEESYFPELERLKGENDRKDQLITFLHERLLVTPKPKVAHRILPSPRLENQRVAKNREIAEKLETLAAEIEHELSRNLI